jgi:CRP-like cAMP-binding protein
VVSGRVKITTATDDGCNIVVRIVPSEEFFGESALVRPTAPLEQAVALETVTLMAWSAAEIEQLIESEPQAGVALVKYVLRQALQLEDRIESIAFHHTRERVAIALLQLAEPLGKPMPDGKIRVLPLTHETIAEFVGTSREIVTCQMNRLRRLRAIEYTRRYIDVDVPAIEESLRSRGVTRPGIGMSSRPNRDGGGFQKWPDRIGPSLHHRYRQ